ncbi:TadE/TadG family type IV pilus assembly protein [Phenylobacterium sp.]|jgi:Flp pilus assembly protein TadG|uniref:TadE/TadG family type IV pilus assembly protein n=1 Tax=Phenylobacterium sp. TaxID=1871053 RepID=UPI002F920A3B
MTRRGRSLWRDRRGGAMVEFAIVLPFMLLLLIGFAEGIQMLEAHRRVSRAASTIGDLAAQYRTLSDSQIADILVAGQLVVEPMPTSTLGLRLMSFSADANGTVRKDWAKDGTTPYAGTAPDSVPSGTLKANQGIVVADASYVYVPMARWIVPSNINLQKRMLLRPRIADAVTRTP